ncbi:hypothetical protein EDB85DRAFT_1434289 [Lactarius pseudohatsudake]|nr:hypothetical protein EDB85DRAFT_1434289 [Lactarius pseudohatsudake]
MSLDCDVAIGYNLLVVGATGRLPFRINKRIPHNPLRSDAGVHDMVTAYLEEPTTTRLPPSFLRSNQKPVRLANNRLIVLDITERPGDIFRECCGDLYVVRFHEQMIRSKWRSLPVVLFANIPPRRGVKQVHGYGRSFADAHAIPFIEALPSRPSPVPFTVLLDSVRRHHEASTSPTSFGEGIIDFFTVAAAKVSHAARSHFPTFPTPHASGRTA